MSKTAKKVANGAEQNFISALFIGKLTDKRGNFYWGRFTFRMMIFVPLIPIALHVLAN